MLGHKKQFEKIGILIGVTAVAVIAFIAIFNPDSKAIRLQTKAGEVISDYVASLEKTEGLQSGIFYCILPSIYPDAPKGINLDQAISWLNEAKSIAPRNTYSSFLLGQAYCLAGNYPEAIVALDDFLARRPDNLLAKTEAGFAYLALAQSIGDPQNALMYRTKSMQLLEEAGFPIDSFVKEGDASFKQEKNQDSLVWYGMGDSLYNLPESRLFRYTLLQLIFQGSSTYPDQIKDGMIMELARELSADPTSFFELATGSTFLTNVIDGKLAVTILYNAQHAGILLNVVEANRFCFSIIAIDKPPQFTQIGLDVDFKTFTTLELMNGDSESVQFDFDIILDHGFHVLGIKLLNDKYIEGVIDRNAYIESIRIEVCQSD